jgi:hypothetical protein
MTDEEADKAQSWRKISPQVAWHLIERHSEGWDDINTLMAAYVRAHINAEREAIIEAIPGGCSVDPQWVCDMIRERSNLKSQLLATLYKTSNNCIQYQSYNKQFNKIRHLK